MRGYNFFASVALGALAFASQAGAQTAVPGLQAAAAQSEAIETSAADIVVTAQRRPERLQNVPISVAAVSAQTLTTRAINDFNSLSRVAPSLQPAGDNNFSVRGVGTLAFSQSLESSVALAQDEVNLTSPSLFTDFFDVAQVEVLNGPQGLLFGKNASAGLINVTTVAPKLGSFGGSVDVEGDYRDTAPGTSDGVIVRGALNIPVTANSALRVSGFYTYQNPIFKFVGPQPNRVDLDRRRFAGRVKYLIEPTSKLSVLLTGEYGEEHGVLGIFENSYRQLSPGSVNAAPLAQIGIVAGSDNLEIGGNGGFWRDLKRHSLQGKATYTSDNGWELSDIAAWKGFNRDQQIDTDYTGQNGADINHNHTNFDQYSNELRLALPAGNRLSGQVGLYYFHSDLASHGQVAGNNYFPSFLLPSFPFCVGATTTAGPPPACNVSNKFFLGNDHALTQSSDSYAAFGQLTYKITDELQLLAGGRWTHDKIKIDLTQNVDHYFVRLGPVFSGQQEHSNSNFSWKVGAQYNFTANAMAYVTYGKGYKGPGFNDNASSSTAALLIHPETNKNIEAGVKTSWLNRKLVLNASVFRSHFSNYQVQSFDLISHSFVTQNAATLRSKGAEITANATPLPGLTLNASATILNAHFGSFPGAQCYPTQGCTTFDAAGRRPPLSPKFTATGEVLYDRSLTEALHWFIEGNWYHRSAVGYGISPAPGTHYGSFDQWGGSLGLRGDRWRASVFCRNCTDKRVPQGIGVEPGDSFSGMTSYTQSFNLNSFRTIGVQLGFNF